MFPGLLGLGFGVWCLGFRSGTYVSGVVWYLRYAGGGFRVQRTRNSNHYPGRKVFNWI